VIVICELLGIAPADHERFAGWVPPLVMGFDATAALSRGVLKRADDAALQLDAYVRELVAQRRVEPTDDLISRLVEASDGDDRLTEDEVVAFVALLLVAGHETTANMLGNGLVALWRHPDQLDRWRSEPSVRPAGVEELLRYDSTVQMMQRLTTAPIDLGTGTIPAGRMVLLLIAAANRDPQRFTDPDRLDLGRSEGPSMAFGFGIHHCLGAALARAEVVIGLGALLDRFPDLSLGPEPFAWRNNMIFRGLEALPATW
jgi:cytochrome P450